MSNVAENSENLLTDWHQQAITLQKNINQTILGQEHIIDLMGTLSFCSPVSTLPNLRLLTT